MSNDKLAEALRELFVKWLESRSPFRTTVEVEAAWEGWKANTAIAAMLAAEITKPVAWSCQDTINDDDGCPIGMDEPRVHWGSGCPDDDGGWLPLYTCPQPAQDAKDAKDAWPEEWRSFAEGYEVSSHGRTRSKGRLLQPYVKGKGYLAVSVWHGGKNKEMYVHRVVASAFCRRDDPSQDQVNHRDGDKLNNYASNLEWCTAKENRMHAARVLFSATRSVAGTNLKTGETITFRSLAEAEEHGFIRANIQKCIAGIRKKHGGFTWRDADAAIDAAMAKGSGR